MFSALNSHSMAFGNNSSLMHSFVDSFFLGKKALVKERLRQSLETVVDGLFEEMVEQVKEMLLPPKTGGDETFQHPPNHFQAHQQQLHSQSNNFPNNQNFAQQPKATPPPPPKNMFFATKSKPGPPSPFSMVYGQKRTVVEEFKNRETSTSNASSAKKLKVDNLPDDERFTQEESGGNKEGGEDESSDYFATTDFDTLGDLTTTHFGKTPNTFTSGNILVQFDDGTATAASTSSAINQNKSTTTKSALKQVPSNTSNTGKKFTCTEEGCGKSFSKGYDLKLHTRCAHSGVKPFGCSYTGCTGFSSADRSNALRHIRNVHLKTDGGKPPEEGGEKEDDPAKYLTVQKELL